MSHRPDPFDALSALGQTRPTSAAQERMRAGAWARVETPERRGLGRILVLVAAAAAALALAIGFGAGTLDAPQSEATGPRAQQIQIGAHRVTAQATAVLEILSADPNAAVVRLDAGRADFDIEPLNGGFFRIEAPWARVEVIGTRFSVVAGPDCTEVSVREGTVRVTGADRVVALTAHERARFCTASDAGAPGQALVITENEADVDLEPVAAVAGEALVHGALDRIGRGVSLDVAAQDLEHYLQRWPEGLFAEEAMFHAALLAHRRGSADARKLAKRFVDRFPGSRRVEGLRPILAP